MLNHRAQASFTGWSLNDISLTQDNAVVVPYVELDGAWLVPDRVVFAFWQVMEDEGAGWTLFRGADMSGPKFLTMLKRPTNVPVLFFERGTETPIGVAWLNGLTDNFAFAHFYFVQEAFGPMAETCGRLCGAYWMKLGVDKPLLDVIIGNIPSVNTSAIAFVKRLGWTVLGEIPYMAGGDAMTVTYLERK